MKHFFATQILTIYVLLILSAGTLIFLPSFSKIEIVPFKIPRIIHNEKVTTLCLSPKYMFNAWYDIERMEKMGEVLDLTKDGVETGDSYYQFYQNPTENKDKKDFSNEGLVVLVDTINELAMLKKPIWASGLFYRHFDDSPTTLQDDTLVQHVKSFPIYIANCSQNKIASVRTQDGSLIMIVEAQDSKHVWKPIEYWSNSWCGNSYFTCIIPSQHYLMTRGIKCSGDFYTKCRVKLTNSDASVYSNEFYMSINETQFEQPVVKDKKKN